MDEHEWTSIYPVSTQHLPNADTPLNFYFRCDTHSVCLDTLASLGHHTSLCNAQQHDICHWTCGHCALTFATSLDMCRHLNLYSVRMGFAKTADFATPKMLNLPYFRRKTHLFPHTALQSMAHDISRAHIVPRYNALHNHSTNALLRLSAEAANIRKSGTPLPQISHSSILFTQTEDANSSDSVNLDTFLVPNLSDGAHISSEGNNISTPPTSMDTISTVSASVQTCDNLCQELSYFQDIRKKLTHTLNVQCALLQQQPSTPLTFMEQQMFQGLLSQNILPLSFTSLLSSNSTEVAQTISAFNLGATHFQK